MSVTKNIVKIGNSVGVILTKELHLIGAGNDKTVTITVDSTRHTITITKAQQNVRECCSCTLCGTDIIRNSGVR